MNKARFCSGGGSGWGSSPGAGGPAPAELVVRVALHPLALPVRQQLLQTVQLGGQEADPLLQLGIRVDQAQHVRQLGLRVLVEPGQRLQGDGRPWDVGAIVLPLHPQGVGGQRRKALQVHQEAVAAEAQPELLQIVAVGVGEHPGADRAVDGYQQAHGGFGVAGVTHPAA